ncbi:hypothetical protein ACFY2W_33045 [Streptomyces sp. NPDC001262]|uniref:hypothetical protein n=1 Tax=Streptomyces sp. NPDC001262 TaxID=3364552 RepID=UPI0036AF5EE1
MPNRRYKIQLSLAPFGAALLIAAHGVVKHCNAEVSLPLYVSVILGFLLGFAGRRKELREKARDIATNGNNRNNQLSKAAQVQVVVVIIIMAGVGSWLSMVG